VLISLGGSSGRDWEGGAQAVRAVNGWRNRDHRRGLGSAAADWRPLDEDTSKGYRVLGTVEGHITVGRIVEIWKQWITGTRLIFPVQLQEKGVCPHTEIILKSAKLKEG